MTNNFRTGALAVMSERAVFRSLRDLLLCSAFQLESNERYSALQNKRSGVAQVLDGLFGTPLRKIWSLTTFLIASCAKRWTGSLNPPARPCTSLILAAPPAPRCWTGGSHPPFARASLSKNGLPPAQDVGRASGTLLREFRYFVQKRLRPVGGCRTWA